MTKPKPAPAKPQTPPPPAAAETQANEPPVVDEQMGEQTTDAPAPAAPTEPMETDKPDGGNPSA